ncbi:hypothetical protein SAY87_013139 [Trapa incisa]|uniref:AMP-activated protein kinase glycogen-binding domain-containing protein n=1 Tax=Trapa incisa TaxID=236973 RepID=A0AAN7KGK1_9MYRT|nr:hypothetical protein SAY87_013139 [Trapa incisa]
MLSLALAFPPVLVDSAPNRFPSFLLFPRTVPISRRPGSLTGVEVIGWPRNRSDICRGSGLVSRCGREGDGEGDPSLEDAILEFMKSSENPNLFPNKKQLLDAGRADLVEAISRRGGWLSLGWDLECEDGIGHFQYDIDVGDGHNDRVSKEVGSSNQLSRNCQLESRNGAKPSSFDASHPGVPLESPSVNNSGIEGILSRLEKERNITFGVDLRDKGDNNPMLKDGVQHGSHRELAFDEIDAGFRGRIKPTSLISRGGVVHIPGANATRTGTFADVGRSGNTTHPASWRAWSIRRAGFSEDDFEAAEIVPLRDGMEGLDFLKKDVVEMEEDCSEHIEISSDTIFSHDEISHDHIKIRLQHLEAELSDVLKSLRSSHLGDEKKSPATVSKDLQELSDAWEFQENEVMNAQDRLRSIRARVAVLEGKMALAIIDAQKTLEEKQKRIEVTSRALRLLRTACIVWPNSASEVLLSGSFDGWMTQRRMEKSSTGIFSLYLKLYPGKYEIKFIVDGTWKIDPLRPIVNNNGYENNLLIIT